MGAMLRKGGEVSLWSGCMVVIGPDWVPAPDIAGMAATGAALEAAKVPGNATPKPIAATTHSKASARIAGKKRLMNRVSSLCRDGRRCIYTGSVVVVGGTAREARNCARR